MKPRAAWPILAKKAKEKCDQAMAALVKGREKIKSLEQSRGRMEALYADYLARSIAAEKKISQYPRICELPWFFATNTNFDQACRCRPTARQV